MGPEAEAKILPLPNDVFYSSAASIAIAVEVSE